MSNIQHFPASVESRDNIHVSIYDEWLPSQAAADYLGFQSDVILKKSRVDGLLCGVKAPPYRKVGVNVRYKLADLHAWMESFPAITHSGSEEAA